MFTSKNWTGTEGGYGGWMSRESDADNRGNRMRINDTMKYQVLKRIYKSGHEGMRYTDVVKFIIENLKGGKYNYKIHRGYWGTNLIGTSYEGPGLLNQYCKKNDNKKWMIRDAKLLDHFNDLKEKGLLDRSWSEIEAKEKGWDEDDIGLFNDLGMLKDMMSDAKNTEE